jgi:hypothetical protein
MSALLFGTKYDSLSKFRQAAGTPTKYTVYVLGIEDTFLNIGKTPMYLKGKLSDFPDLIPGTTIIYECPNGKVLKADIDSVSEDAHGWGFGSADYMTDIMLKNPSIPFTEVRGVFGGTTYVDVPVNEIDSGLTSTPGTGTLTDTTTPLTTTSTPAKPKSNLIKYVVILLAVVAGGVYLYKKYKK